MRPQRGSRIASRLRRRRRIAVAENAIRGIIGGPQLVPAGQPVVLQLGPATARTSGSLELRVIRAAVGAVTISERVTVTVRGYAQHAPRSLTQGEETLVALIAALGAEYAEMNGASPLVTFEVGLCLYLVLREFCRRYLPPRA